MSGRNGYMTHEEFKIGCQREFAARPEGAGWTLEFPAPQDAERLWTVTAWRKRGVVTEGDDHRVTVEDFPAARATASTPKELVDGLIQMIRNV